MAKKTSIKKMDFMTMSADELRAFVSDSHKKVEEITMSVSSKNPAQKRALRRSIARALTALRAQ